MPSRSRKVSSQWRGVCLALAGGLCVLGCDSKGPSLSKNSLATGSSENEDFEMPQLGGTAPNGPLLGALSDRSPIFSAVHKKSPILGYLHAGDTIPRSENSYENDQCTEGWYAVAPRGYMCTERSASTDMLHPTLRTMALEANLNKSLPYTYARTTKVTALFDRKDDRGVTLGGRLAKSTVMAIVGSWTAPDESREPQRLGLKMDGRFVRAEDLRAAEGSSFTGTELSDEVHLPVAYVVRRGVKFWKMDGSAAIKAGKLKFHERRELTGRYRTVQEQRFWATKDSDIWVRHKDVTVLRKRHEFPEFATGEQKWIDVSIITGSAIAYEGQKAIYATLVSVGRDRLGDSKTTASTERGSFRVVQKQITQRRADGPEAPLHDAPWALKLESGNWIYASPSHNRFGIEHTDGDIEVSPSDGRFLWHWSTPSVPPGWHGVMVEPAQESTIVQIRR